MADSKQILEKLVGMVTDLQQSQLKMLEKQNEMSDAIDHLTNVSEDILERVENLESDMDLVRAVQNDHVKRIRKLESK
jgi:peptidoglycan hydrolase CwlO-like protein